MTLPRYQPRTHYLAPLGKILAFTRGCKQRSSAATSFPTFQSLEGEMLVSFYALKALQLKEDLTIFSIQVSKKPRLSPFLQRIESQ